MNIVSVFRDFRKIYGICPCCGELFRLSEADVYAKTPTVPSVIDNLRFKEESIERAESDLEEALAGLRNKARNAGEREAHRRLRALARPFTRRRIDPNDVKVIFDPVRFVAFSGMTQASVTAIAFMDRPATTSARGKVQSSLERSLRAGNIEWLTVRVNDDGRVSGDLK